MAGTNEEINPHNYIGTGAPKDWRAGIYQIQGSLDRFEIAYNRISDIVINLVKWTAAWEELRVIIDQEITEVSFGDKLTCRIKAYEALTWVTGGTDNTYIAEEAVAEME